MLEIETLRAVQAAVAVCTFVLVLGGTYRTTRAPYALWWSGAVLGSSIGTAFYLVADAAGSTVLTALGHGVSVSSAGLIWGATRALRGRPTPAWVLAAGGIVVTFLAVLPNLGPTSQDGTLWLLCGMTAFIALAAWELWHLSRHPRLRGRETLETARSAVVSVGVGATLMALFYGARVVSFLTAGPESEFYVTWTGPTATTLAVTLMLVVVTYSVTELSHLELSSEWRQRATHDDLTGLLARAEFMARGQLLVDDGATRGSPAVLVLADIDHFKEVNDTHGHAAGDRTLASFGDACREVMRREDIAGRLGGEEFALLISSADSASAVAVSTRLSEAFERLHAALGHDAPTLSYGVAVVDPRKPLAASLSRADAALYRAKRAGRDRVAVDGE